MIHSPLRGERVARPPALRRARLDSAPPLGGAKDAPRVQHWARRLTSSARRAVMSSRALPFTIPLISHENHRGISRAGEGDRKSTRLNSSHSSNSDALFFFKKK